MSESTLPPAAPPAAGHKPFLGEGFVLALLLTGFLLVNLLTAARSPAVWQDEVMFADPAVNFHQGHGFVSGAWYAQSFDRRWAGNMPLYQFILVGWLKLVGFSLTKVRSLHYVLVGLAVGAAWLALRRMRLVDSPAQRLAFCFIMCLASSTTFVFRGARPESLGMLLVMLVLLVATIPTRAWRLGWLFGLGILLTGTGLQLAAYAGIMGGLLWLIGPPRFRAEIITLGAGCATGMALVFFQYSSLGVWKEFVASVQRHTLANQHSQYDTIAEHVSFFAHPGGIFLPYKDYSFIPLFLLVVWLAWRQFQAGWLKWQSPLVFGLAVTLVVPVVMFAIGVFPIYYYWMSFIPMALCLCAALSRLPPETAGRPLRFMALSAIGLACLLGLPRRLAVAAGDWQARDYQPVMVMAAPYVNRNTVVYADFAAYYAAKQNGAIVVLPPCVARLSPEQKRQVTIAIIRPGNTNWLAGIFGGEWKASGAGWKPKTETGFLGLHEQLDSRAYNLMVWAREPSR